MTWAIVSLAGVEPQPWRNGGGLTRELLAWPSRAEWRVRLSVADVRTAGPFSRFEGVERWIAVLDGAGLVLRFVDHDQRLNAQSDPFAFEGAAAVHAMPTEGPTRCFSLMALPGTARLQRVRDEALFATTGPMLMAVYTHREAAVVVLDGRVTDLPARHLAWRLGERPCAGSVAGREALWIEAAP